MSDCLTWDFSTLTCEKLSYITKSIYVGYNA